MASKRDEKAGTPKTKKEVAKKSAGKKKYLVRVWAAEQYQKLTKN